MEYGVDLKKLSCREYLNILKNQNLLPGRRLLLEDIDERFRRLEDAGIAGAAQLQKSLGTPAKLSALSQQTGIPAEYLTVLKRELNSLVPKPVNISDFPGVPEDTAAKLAALGIRSSQDLFNSTAGFSEIPALASRAGIPDAQAQELCILCDLARVSGVGPVFARLLMQSGIRSAAEIARSEAGNLLERFNRVNDAAHAVNVRLGLKDMQFCIDYARLLAQMA